MNKSTLNDLFSNAMGNIRNPKAFQHKVDGAYRAISAEDFERRCHEIGIGLLSLGLEPGDRVGLLSPNRIEWAVCDFGILLNGAINVPVYPTLLAEQIQYILENSEAKFIFCADSDQSQKVLSVKDRLPRLKQIIQFDDAPAGEDVSSLADLAKLGVENMNQHLAEFERRAEATQPDDPCSYIYTSGTTGPPKGVILSHRNVVSNVEAVKQVVELKSSDVALSFLPLSHILERMGGYYTMLSAGVSIAYAESVDTVPQNLGEVCPTCMVSVPRLYEKMYARILDAAVSGGFLKKNIFFWAKMVGERWAELTIAGDPIPPHIAHSYKVANKLVFSKLRARTGGNLRFFISGGAPLSADIAKFFYAAGLVILEGYGLTETSPVITANTFENYRLGTVGKPIPGVEVKIAADGEILTRGPNVMKGYYKDEAATRETIDPEGWLATGDIGMLTSEGFLRITDRKKDIIVTAGGKNIAPQPIENLLKTDKFISECVVIGDSKPYISALVIPNFEYLVKYAKRKEIIYTSMKGLINELQVQKLYRRRVTEVNKQLARYEQIKRFRLLDHELTLEGGELTPSLKVRRREVFKLYSDLIDSIYQEEGR
jgi:long-chain acyl-CoA synthetase